MLFQHHGLPPHLCGASQQQIVRKTLPQSMVCPHHILLTLFAYQGNVTNAIPSLIFVYCGKNIFSMFKLSFGRYLLVHIINHANIAGNYVAMTIIIFFSITVFTISGEIFLKCKVYGYCNDFHMENVYGLSFFCLFLPKKSLRQDLFYVHGATTPTTDTSFTKGGFLYSCFLFLSPCVCVYVCMYNVYMYSTYV